MTSSIGELNPSYDVVVAGARCAGAATAMLLARAGVKVLVIEQGSRGADTTSTLALMRAGVLQLSRWGLLDAIRGAGTPPVRTTTFHYGNEDVEVPIKARDGVDALYAPRRTLLDPLLADAASEAGAHIAYRTRLLSLRRNGGGRVDGVVVENGGAAQTIAAGLVIGADGVHSRVAREAAVAPYRLGSHMSAVIYTLVRDVAFEGYQWHYRPGASIGVIPTNGGETLIFAATARRRFLRDLRSDLASSFMTIVRETAPGIAATLSAGSAGPYRGFAGHPGTLRPAWGPGWALVGDAGYFKDPITAHGITDALRDAELLARAVTAGREAALAAYQAERDALSVGLFGITDEIASYAWDMPRLQHLHRSLSEEMARETSHVASLGGLTPQRVSGGWRIDVC